MTSNSTDEKIIELTEQISSLTRQINKQEARLFSLEKSMTNGLMENHSATPFDPSTPSQKTSQDSQEEAVTPGSKLADSGSFLAKLATVCFILAIALILRTTTDSGLIASEAGSKIGTGYAALLIAAGWWMMKQKRNLGPIFPVCGALLMYAIVLETHSRFEVYTSLIAYGILLATMLPLVIMGKHYQLPFFHTIGLLGASFTAFAIDLFHPIFPQLALFLLAANIIAFSSENRQKRWPQVLLYSLTTLFWFLWAAKLHAPLVKGMELAPSLSITSFLPVTLLTAFIFIGFSSFTSFRKGDSLTLFDLVLPALNVLWFYTVCALVVIPWTNDGKLLGYGGLILSLAHFIVAGAIFKFSKKSGAGVCAYVFAGATLVVMATLTVVDNVLLALPFWSAMAVALCFSSRACEIGGIRLTSYLLQCAATIIGIGYGVLSPEASSPVTSLLVAGSLVFMSSYQYYWSRRHPLTCSVGFFANVDPKDYSAVILLFASLLNGFGMFQLAAYHILASYSTAPINALQGTRSILINITAIALMIYGLKKKNKEVLYTSVAVVALGAFKALGYDLFKITGVPLVLSVFSFGVVAAVGSFVFNRWSQEEH